MNLAMTVLLGMGIGVMLELLLPGHTKSELFLAAILGVAGAVVASFVGMKAGWFGSEEAASFITSAGGAILVLLLYGAFFRRGKRPGGGAKP